MVSSHRCYYIQVPREKVSFHHITWSEDGWLSSFYSCLIKKLYTVSIVVLVRFKVYTMTTSVAAKKGFEEDEEHRKPLRPYSDDSGILIPSTPKATPQREFYYTSARSLAGSGTPPFRSYMRAARSSPSAVTIPSDDSSYDDEAPQVHSNKTVSQPRPIPKLVFRWCKIEW